MRVTLVVTFGFLHQNFGRWQGSMNGTLSFYECRFSGENTMRRWGHSKPNVSERIWIFCTHRQWGCKNFRCEQLCPRVTIMELLQPLIINVVSLVILPHCAKYLVFQLLTRQDYVFITEFLWVWNSMYKVPKDEYTQVYINHIFSLKERIFYYAICT